MPANPASCRNVKRRATDAPSFPWPEIRNRLVGSDELDHIIASITLAEGVDIRHAVEL